YSLNVITVATNVTDGFLRFNRSVNVYNLNLEVLGLNDVWKGGDVTRTTGGGYKINLLKNALKKYKDDQQRIVLFVDSYDVVINSVKDEILKRFLETDAKVLFSAEGFCWPDKSLTSSYPKLEKPGKRFLNSGGFIGFAPVLNEIVSYSEIEDTDDDQLYYTHIYINDTLRQKWSIKLDHRATIFQNLNGAVGDVELSISDSGDVVVKNTAYLTYPLIFHGNGASKITINSLGNYLAKAWTPQQCSACSEGVISLKQINPEDAPVVVIALFVEHATPFLYEFFENILNLRYPKSRIYLVIHNAVSYHEPLVEEFVSNNKNKYKSLKTYPLTTPDWQARNMAIEQCLKVECDYYLSVDSDARLTNDKTLIKLIEQNRKVISPMLVRHKSVWANFWGAISHDGFYARSHDYMDIVKNKRR
ncbi:Procollagen-lysine:2-oxoglutarate 5-dioxygenase 3-like protein, partial [Leptotrombidium deliense]